TGGAKGTTVAALVPPEAESRDGVAPVAAAARQIPAKGSLPGGFMIARLGRHALSAAALWLLVLAGCKGAVTPIKTLLDDPSRFDRQSVRIAGTVEESAGIMGFGGYRVNDGTGTVTVV